MHLARIEAEDTTQPQSNRRPTRSAVKSVYSCVLTAAALASILGCGNTYRPVVSAVNPVGPAGQPTKYAIAVSSPSLTSPGLVTIVDFSGDSVLITANLGVNPYYLALNSSGNTGYTLNGDGTVTSFGISTTLQTKDVLQTTLLSGAAPNSILPLTSSTYISEPGRNSIAQLTGSPPALKQELPVDTGYTPVYIAGAAAGTRAYAISQATAGGPGQVAAIDIASNTISNRINVGIAPIYGVMTADGRRVFVMNQGDGTVSVINAQTNQLDTPPTGSTNPIVVGTAPVWADLAPARNEMVVANAGDGTKPGSLSIVNIPLCSVVTLPSNPGCDVNNPVDAVGFGQVLATVPVGVNSLMVAVLQDIANSRAYVLNQGDLSQPCTPPTAALPAGNCSVSVVNLTTNTVTATIPISGGHPNFIAATSGTPTGKVYVTSPESNAMTIIRTDTDTVETTVDLQGKGVQVRVTAP
ncbi:MAG TPA: YncE family protein [Edaphobacter sp.]|nr:YncE family protein [Edaphobacter sp.]